MFEKLSTAARGVLRSPRLALAVGGLAGALLWVFWPTLAELSRRWAHDAQYSHGYLVPFFALYLLWARRDRLPEGSPAPSWWGLPLLAAGLALRFAGTALYLESLAQLALLPCLAGCVVLLGGWRAFRWAWPAVAFLVFMFPLPYRLETALAHPLQRVATLASTYGLQTVGFAAFAEGNVIRMGEVRIGVVEACSGLSMLVIFFALSTAVALVVRRPPLDRSLIFLSAIPIALVANITRITVTGVLHKTAGSELANLVFHDLAGWLMMPYALALLWVELRLLDWVLVPAAPPEHRPARFQAGLELRKAEKAEPARKVAAKPKSPWAGASWGQVRQETKG